MHNSAVCTQRLFGERTFQWKSRSGVADPQRSLCLAQAQSQKSFLVLMRHVLYVEKHVWSGVCRLLSCHWSRDAISWPSDFCSTEPGEETKTGGSQLCKMNVVQ